MNDAFCYIPDENVGFVLVYGKDKPYLGGNIIGSYRYKDITYEGDCNSFTPDLWDYLISKFNVKSVLDVGCGAGYTSKYFLDRGCSVTAIDGLRFNIEQCCRGIIGVVCDLQDGPFISKTAHDLVWSCEVAEHIDARYVMNFVNTLKMVD